VIKPASHDFQFGLGATLRKTFVRSKAGVPVDMTGFTGLCHFRDPAAPVEAEPALVFSSANGGFLLDPTAGKFALYAGISTIAVLTPNIHYLYDILLTDVLGNGDSFYIVKGTATPSLMATR
jgi:hypothetical protein